MSSPFVFDNFRENAPYLSYLRESKVLYLIYFLSHCFLRQENKENYNCNYLVFNSLRDQEGNNMNWVSRKCEQATSKKMWEMTGTAGCLDSHPKFLCNIGASIFGLQDLHIWHTILWSRVFWRATQDTAWYVSVDFLLLQEVGLSATTPEPCLPTHYHVPCHDDNGLNLWNCKWATPIKCFLYKGCHGHGVYSQQ